MDTSGSSEKPRVLAEEEYKEALSQIIQRDFFPDLPRLQAENQVYGGEASNTPTAPVQKERFFSPTGAEKMTLSGFLSTHTTEDNASFQGILDAENAGRPQRQKSTCRPPGNLSSASLLRTNPLLLMPEDSSKHLGTERSTRTGGRIVYENTRFGENNGGSGFAHDRGEIDTDSEDSESAEASTPVINGYRMIKEPSGAGRQRGFVIRPESPRERIARKVGATPRKSLPGARPLPKGALSPAAQRLLMRSSGSALRSPGPTSGAQSADGPRGMLRKSYRSPYPN
ncbi:hypothetical protein LPJ75_007245 [Coemansia sp. RSA 2598]|nr:hypothetical protein LPJ75_007245 [Coemansia sp. RSA 2598]